MSLKVVLTPGAITDIAGAAAWYRERSVRAAEEFLLAVNLTLQRLAAHPSAHPIIEAGTGARRTLLRKFPQRVPYLIESERIIVFAVMHHRRDEPAWRERLMKRT